jgi:hypothetical protein
MAIPWPHYLPQTPFVGIGPFEAVPNRIEFSTDVGPPMSRQRTTLAMTIVPWSFVFTKTQLSAFKTFYDTTLLSGSQRFSAIDPYHRDIADFKFVGDYSVERVAPNRFRMTSTIVRVS